MKNYQLYGRRTSEISSREERNRALAQLAANEGIVLLKNEGVLPLTDKQLALYGAGARKTVRGGLGSGDVHERFSVDVEGGLLDEGYTILNKKWMDRYDQDYEQTKDKWRADLEEKIKDYTIEKVNAMFEVIDAQPFLLPTGPIITQEEIDPSAFIIITNAREVYGKGFKEI